MLIRLKNIIFKKQFAYKQLFNKNNPAGEAVLADLAVFCRGNKSTFNTDPRVHALVEGRREVLLRIVKYTGLTAEELFELSINKKALE